MAHLHDFLAAYFESLKFDWEWFKMQGVSGPKEWLQKLTEKLLNKWDKIKERGQIKLNQVPHDFTLAVLFYNCINAFL